MFKQIGVRLSIFNMTAKMRKQQEINQVRYLMGVDKNY